MKHVLHILLLSAVFYSTGSAQNYSVSGLEYNSNLVNVVVEDVSKDAQMAGVLKGALLEKCLTRLRQNGFNPDSNNAMLPYLYLNVNIGKSDRNYLFTAKLEFKRLVVFDDTGLMTGKGETYAMQTTTWSRSTLGDFESDGGFVMKAVDGFLDDFVKGFVKSNPNFKPKKKK